MNDRAKLSLAFDPQRLRDDLSKLSQVAWIEHFVKQNYEGNWSVLPLRGPSHATHPVMMIYSDPACTEFASTPFLAECAYFQEVLSAFRCELHCVRLMRLAPASEIKEHSDHDLAVENGMARLHIPITTHPDVEFYLNGERVTLQPGECWYLRLSDPHRVVNRGPTDRVHMVLDAVVNDWLRQRIGESSDRGENHGETSLQPSPAPLSKVSAGTTFRENGTTCCARVS